MVSKTLVLLRNTYIRLGGRPQSTPETGAFEAARSAAAAARLAKACDDSVSRLSAPSAPQQRTQQPSLTRQAVEEQRRQLLRKPPLSSPVLVPERGFLDADDLAAAEREYEQKLAEARRLHPAPLSSVASFDRALISMPVQLPERHAMTSEQSAEAEQQYEQRLEAERVRQRMMANRPSTPLSISSPVLQPERGVLHGQELADAERQFQRQLDEQRRKQDAVMDAIESPPPAPPDLLAKMTRVSVADATADMRNDRSVRNDDSQILMQLIPPRGPSFGGIPVPSNDDSRVYYPPRGPSMTGDGGQPGKK